MMREEPIMTETMLLKALRTIRKLSAFEELPAPKTALKKRDAASCLEVRRDTFGTAAKYAMLHRR